MSNLNFLHFDTAFKDSPTDDPFNCCLTLANPLRKVKKIYLKSCEIPIGFFNIRETYNFSFRMRFPASAYQSGTEIGGKIYTFSPNVANNYLINNVVPVSGTIDGSYGALFSIDVVPGNYTIDSLLTYLNTGIDKIYQKCIIDLQIKSDFNTSPNLTKLTVSDTGAFPVGYVQLNYSPGFTVSEFNSNFITNYVLGIQTDQTDSTVGYIIGRTLWSIYNDLSIALYFSNIPHNNTHFSSQLMSFKIPVKGGVQSIEFNGESQNFSQYIELSDPHFILSQIKLQIFDTKGNLLKNQYNFHFTLGFEYNSN